jgi:hypothetical protein
MWSLQWSAVGLLRIKEQVRDERRLKEIRERDE